MRHGKLSPVWLAASALALTAATSAHAAAPTPAAADTGPEMVVTARRVAEVEQRVPIAMTALNANALKQRSITSVNDLQYAVPNLMFSEGAVEPQSFNVTIRGQSQNDIPLTVDPSVGIYIDGLYYPRTIGLKGALVDLDRVEVLRGPQGTLYGRNTTGGAVGIYTANPTDKLEGSIDFTGGNYGAINVVGMGNFPLSDNAQLRVVLQRGYHDGYGTDALGNPLEKEDSFMGRAKLHFTIGSKIDATLFGDYQQNSAGGGIWKLTSVVPFGGLNLEAAVEQYGLSAIAPAPNFAEIGASLAQLQSYIGTDPYHTFTTDPSQSLFHGSTIGFDLKAHLSDYLTVRSITGWQSLDRVNTFDTDGTPFHGVNSTLTTTDNYYSEELQILGGGDKLNWVAGAYFGFERGTEGGSNILLPDILPLSGAAEPFVFAADVANNSYAGFVQANWEFAPTWRLTGGVRYSVDQRTIVSHNTVGGFCAVPAPQPGTPCSETFSNTFSSPNWVVSLDHQFTNRIMGYAKVSTGYRSGGENFRGDFSPESFSSFKPEDVLEYEVGAKSELFDRRVKLNAAFFYDSYTNIQRSVSVPVLGGGATTIVANAAQATIWGFEVEGDWRVTDKFSLHGSTSYTNAKYKPHSFINPADGTDLSGEPFPIPAWTAGISARYVQPITGLGDLALQLDYHWQSDVDLFPQNENPAAFTQKAYGLLDGRLNLHIDGAGTDVALFAKNIANTTYFVNGESLEDSLGFGILITGVPRTFGVQITKHFGG